MASGVEARSAYGGLMLSCDAEAFALIRGHILSEPSVAEAIGHSHDSLGMRFISVRTSAIEDTPGGPGWLALLPTVVAGGLSGVALIVGYVAIIRWLLRLIG